jgi:hypothetical protein
MSERFIANTQYDDLLGTIAIQEYQAIGETSYDLLEKLGSHADIPQGYEVIGFEITTASPINLEKHGIMSYYVICVRPDKVGHGADHWRTFAEDHGGLPVYRFRGRVNFDEFRSLIAQLNIKIAVGVLDGVNLTVQSVET